MKRGVTQWWRLLAPHSLSGRVGGLVLAATCIIALALIFLAEKATPPSIVFGALSFLPVLLAVWLLSGWLAAVVTGAAVLLRIGAFFFAGIHPVTVAVEVGTIATVAAVGWLAAVTVSAYWAAQALAEERERIARELHDGTIQSLFAVGMGLRAARLAEDHEVRKGIDEAIGELDQVIRELRNYVFGLRPILLADRQLDQALEELVRDLQEKTRVKAVADIDHMVAAGLTPKAGEVIQLAREALSNVGRHANAHTCRLSLRREGRLAVLEVRDDGRGFDVSGVDGSGQGLANMRQRAAALGGSVTIEAGPAQGTSVRIAIPMALMK